MSTGLEPFDPVANPYFCTDEDIAIEASKDYQVLCPEDQKDFSIADGVLDPADPWSLASATLDFARCGLTPGKIVTFTGPMDPFRNGEQFAFDHIDELDSHRIYTRRKGKPSGFGFPPGNGLAVAGVEAHCSTLMPQIFKASREIEDELGIQKAIAERGQLFIAANDVVNLADATVSKVLERQYMAIAQLSVIPGSQDTFIYKSGFHGKRFATIFMRLGISFSTGEEVATRRRWRRIRWA